MKRILMIIGIMLFLIMLLLPLQMEARTLIDMGECKITFYCPCEICSDNFGRQTSSGAVARSGHTVAVDPEVFDIGSKILIDGKIYTAEDVGGGVKGDHVDIFVDTHEETLEGGLQHKDVWVVRK